MKQKTSITSFFLTIVFTLCLSLSFFVKEGFSLPGEAQVYKLRQKMDFNQVIRTVGPPSEKIIKKVKKEDVWLYETFDVVFRDGKLKRVHAKDERVVLHSTLQDKKRHEEKKQKEIQRRAAMKKQKAASQLLQDIGAN